MSVFYVPMYNDNMLVRVCVIILCLEANFKGLYDEKSLFVIRGPRRNIHACLGGYRVG